MIIIGIRGGYINIPALERYHISLHGEAGHAGSSNAHDQGALSKLQNIISQVESSAYRKSSIATIGSINRAKCC